MKRILCIAMALVMMLGVNVYASSYASLNKTRTIRDGAEPSDQYLTITPHDAVETGSSIVISFTNADVVSQEQINGVYQYSHYLWEGQGFWDVVPKYKTNELPYRIQKIGKNRIQVYLMNIPRGYANRSLYSVNKTYSKPVYRIRLPFIANGAGRIDIKIENNESTVSSATLSGYRVFNSNEGFGEDTSPAGLTDTEGADGEILEPTTVEMVTETTTSAVVEETSEETTELNIFDMEYDELIAVRDISDIISELDELSYVDWDSATKTVTISFRDTVVKFMNEADHFIINDEIIPYEEEQTRATIIDRRMYVPVGIIIEALDLEPPAEETTESITEGDADGTTEETTEAVTESILEETTSEIK